MTPPVRVLSKATVGVPSLLFHLVMRRESERGSALWKKKKKKRALEEDVDFLQSSGGGSAVKYKESECLFLCWSYSTIELP